jgi:hypothetical protein
MAARIDGEVEEGLDKKYAYMYVNSISVYGW